MAYHYQALEAFMPYQGEKYISPIKAKEREEEMLELRVAGQTARASFQSLASQVEQELLDFKMEKVSQWMNQAQVIRPHFWCYFRSIDGTVADPTFAIRMKTGEDNLLRLSVEVSVIERGVQSETINRQNQVLDIPLQPPLYYWVQRQGQSHAEITGDEPIRQSLKEAELKREVRKVLVKYDLPTPLNDLSLDEVVKGVLNGIVLLTPSYHEANKRLSRI